MKFLLAQMKHETNTFSPVVTDLARFARGQSTPYQGHEAYQAFRGTGSAIGAFIEVAERAGARVDRPDQHVYKIMSPEAKASSPYVLMSNTGWTGRFNRAQRGAFNTDGKMVILSRFACCPSR